MRQKSKSYKWVILTSIGTVYLRKKPRKVRGGYMDEYGCRFLGIAVSMMTREMYDQVFSL